jgi:hypothetical protein
MKRWLMVLAVALSTFASLLPSGVAEAAPFARAEWRGYFSNGLDTFGDDVISGGITSTSATAFVNKIRGELATSGRDQTGAEFIVLNMMGYAPGTSRSVAHGTTLLNDWEARVRYYATQGWVNWNTTISFSTNTYWQGNSGGGSDPDDDAWYNQNASAPSIVFHQPGTSNYYRIRRACGNPVGDTDALAAPPVNYSVALTASAPGATGSSPYPVQPGSTYSVRAQVTNNGPANSEAGTIQVRYPGATQVNQPCSPACNPGSQAALTPGGGTKGFRTNSTIPGVSGTNWFWNVPSLSDGASRSGTLQFTVAAGAPVNSTITFDVYYYKGNLAGAVRHATVQFRVVSVRSPGLAGYNADIHAGGGLCKQTTGTGTAKGYPGAGSFGEYVVSASAASGINGLRSSGSTGADDLRLGQNGSYAQVCRPDLLAAANAYNAAGVGYSTIGGSSFDVTGKSGVYFYYGGNLSLSGTVNNKLTVVATSGNITISGPIRLDNVVHTSRTAPSLGVIASGDINISAAVTQVDAYLFSNGIIDTCYQANISCATAPLIVRGFLMARGMEFHRIGVLNSTGTPLPATEQVTLTPQIYLNPPKLFDASVDDILLEGQGERQPLF